MVVMHGSFLHGWSTPRCRLELLHPLVITLNLWHRLVDIVSRVQIDANIVQIYIVTGISRGILLVIEWVLLTHQELVGVLDSLARSILKFVRLLGA